MTTVADEYETTIAEAVEVYWPAAEAPQWDDVLVNATQRFRRAVTILGNKRAREIFYDAWRKLEEQRDTRYPTARALLDVWEMPWSGKRMRFAHHRIRALYSAGLDVLDVDRTQPGHDLDR